MKKTLLLATAALVVTAGSASAAYEICKLKGTSNAYVYKDFSKEEAVVAAAAAKPAEKTAETKKVEKKKAVEAKKAEKKVEAKKEVKKVEEKKVEKATKTTAKSTKSNSLSSFGPYVGFDYSRAELDFKRGGESLVEDDYNAYAIVAGTKFNKYLGVEAYAQNAGRESYHHLGSKVTSSYYSLGADLLGYLPIYDGLEALGGVGLGYYKSKAKFLSAGSRATARDEFYGMRYTLGLQYNLDKNWAVRAAYRYVNFTETSFLDHSNEFLAGVRYSF